MERNTPRLRRPPRTSLPGIPEEVEVRSQRLIRMLSGKSKRTAATRRMLMIYLYSGTRHDHARDLEDWM